MPDDFRFDVFLSHSSKDKPVVRDIAEQLKKDGVKVWFDEWEIKLGGNIPTNAFGADCAQLKARKVPSLRLGFGRSKIRSFISMETLLL